MTTRKARQARSRAMANRVIFAFLVLLALGALYGLAGVSRPIALSAVAPAGPTGQLTVTSAILACPTPGSTGITSGGIAEASVPAGAGPGKLTLTRLDPTARSLTASTRTVISQPGQLFVRHVKSGPAIPEKLSLLPRMAGRLVPTFRARGGLVVRASGSAAQGLDVEQLGPDGQPTARCEPPGSDFWFVGPAQPGLRIQLFLLNTDDEPADASVSVQTDSGPYLGLQDSGIVIPPHTLVVQRLDRLVHGAKAVAFNVTTSTGRLMAAVRETASPARPGTWLPAAQLPARSQIITGLPATLGTRELFITTPGNAAAQVKVTAVTPRGSYQPTGGGGISLLGHQTTGISIPSIGGFPGSIKVSANVPVVAMLEVSGGPSGAPGVIIGSSDAITEQGVVAASPAGSAGKTELVLSAPAGAAQVRITEAGPGAPLTGSAGRIVRIAAGSASEVRVALPRHSAKSSLLAIVVTPVPGSGPVYCARIALVGGAVRTILPVVSSPDTIELPSVTQSVLSILGS